jgi:hypothetical protein
LRDQTAKPVMVDNPDDIALEEISRPLCRFGKIDQPYRFTFQWNIQQGRQESPAASKI